MPDQWGVDYDDDLARKRLDAFAAYMLDLRQFWPKITSLFTRWMGRQFKSEGAYWGGYPWQPLSPRYAAWKALHYPGKGILVAEGDLRRGSTMLTPSQIQASPRFLVLTIEWPKKATRYTSRFDPGWHHVGEGNNPPRPLLQEHWLNPEQHQEIDEAVDEYVEEVATLVGLNGPGGTTRPSIGVV